MKFLIGIYQEKAQIEQHFDALHLQHRDIMEVGPFSSKRQAQQWMEYIGSKLQPYSVERFTVEPLSPNSWFGATFQAD